MSAVNQVARRHVRTEVGVDLESRIVTGDHTGRCVVDNISSGGARVNTRIPVTRGAEVTLHIGSIGTVDGTVAWINGTKLGLRFSKDVSAISDLLFAVAIY